VAFALPIFDDKAVPNFYDNFVIWKHYLRIWNTVLLLHWPLTQLAYCQSSKCPVLARTHARRRTLHQLPNQLHSVEGRAKVQQFLNFVNSWLILIHALLNKAVN